MPSRRSTLLKSVPDFIGSRFCCRCLDPDAQWDVKPAEFKLSMREVTVLLRQIGEVDDVAVFEQQLTVAPGGGLDTRRLCS